MAHRRPVGADATRLQWSAMACAPPGTTSCGADFAALRASAGDFGSAASACLGNDLGATTLDDPAIATAGGDWYLTRGNGCGGPGTYDERGVLSQVETRDPEMLESSAACP